MVKEKIDTQGMSVNENVEKEKELQYTKPSSTQAQHYLIKPLTSCFTPQQRDELKQLMIEVLCEYLGDTTISSCNHSNVIDSDRYDVIERIRDDYHHGGYDEYH